MDIGAILAKIKDNIFLIPEERFDQLTKDPGYGDSFAYLVVSMILYSIISFPVIILGGTASGILETKSVTAGAAVGVVGALLQIILLFVLGIPLRYIVYGIQHILLRLVGGTGTYLKTVQVMIYGGTSANVLGAIPCIGWIFGFVSLANMVLGAKRAHNISLLKSIVALVLIPIMITAVLVAALIVIGLLGQFTGVGSSGLEQQSRAYWQGASPFSIQNAKMSTAGATFEMQNKFAKKLTLTDIKLDTVSFQRNGTNGTISLNTDFAPGQTITLSSVNYTSPCTASGDVYQINSVVFVYNVGGIIGGTQAGDKALYGKCS